jgi:hypothetical protein
LRFVFYIFNSVNGKGFSYIAGQATDVDALGHAIHVVVVVVVASEATVVVVVVLAEAMLIIVIVVHFVFF